MNKPSFPTIAKAYITQSFNNYNPYFYGGDGRHKGIDFGIMPNTPIYACMDGDVSVALNQRTGYGRHIRIIHPDGSMSIYGHLNTLLVSPGEWVASGQQIALSGGDPRDNVDGDGLSTGAHLHWEIRPKGGLTTDQTAVDPLEYCLQYIPEKIRLAEVTAAKGLRVRLSPGTGDILYANPRKTVVKVVETKDNWARLHSLRPEWTWMEYLYFTGDVINPPPATPVPDPAYTDAEKLDILWDAHPELNVVP